MIHIEGLFIYLKIFIMYSVIQNIADSRPKVRYLIAKDDSNSTLEEIVKVRVKHHQNISLYFSQNIKIRNFLCTYMVI